MNKRIRMQIFAAGLSVVFLVACGNTQAESIPSEVPTTMETSTTMEMSTATEGETTTEAETMVEEKTTTEVETMTGTENTTEAETTIEAGTMAETEPATEPLTTIAPPIPSEPETTTMQPPIPSEPETTTMQPPIPPEPETTVEPPTTVEVSTTVVQTEAALPDFPGQLNTIIDNGENVYFFYLSGDEATKSRLVDESIQILSKRSEIWAQQEMEEAFARGETTYRSRYQVANRNCEFIDVPYETGFYAEGLVLCIQTVYTNLNEVSREITVSPELAECPYPLFTPVEEGDAIVCYLLSHSPGYGDTNRAAILNAEDMAEAKWGNYAEEMCTDHVSWSGVAQQICKWRWTSR